MKKLLFSTAFAVMFFVNTASANKIQDAADEAQIPMQYLEINQKCENNKIENYNLCLKDALLKIINKSFTAEQIQNLNLQLAGIEKQVAEAELDENDPTVQALENDPERIKEFRAQNMNLIWKRLLIETINSLKKAMEAQEI